MIRPCIISNLEESLSQRGFKTIITSLGNLAHKADFIALLAGRMGVDALQNVLRPIISEDIGRPGLIDVLQFDHDLHKTTLLCCFSLADMDRFRIEVECLQ